MRKHVCEDHSAGRPKYRAYAVMVVFTGSAMIGIESRGIGHGYTGLRQGDQVKP